MYFLGGDDTGLDPYTETYDPVTPIYSGGATYVPGGDTGSEGSGWTPGGPGYGGGGTTATPTGSSLDSWNQFAAGFSKIAPGLATIFTSARGGTYTIGPGGQITSGYGAGIGAPSTGIPGLTGGISLTTLLIIGAVILFAMKK